MKNISSRPYIDVIDESSVSDTGYVVCHYFFSVLILGLILSVEALLGHEKLLSKGWLHLKARPDY